MVNPKQGLAKWRSHGSSGNRGIRMGRLLTAPLLKRLISINFLCYVTTLKIQYPGKESLICLSYITGPPLAGKDELQVGRKGSVIISPTKTLMKGARVILQKDIWILLPTQGSRRLGAQTPLIHRGQAQRACNLLTCGDWAMQSLALAT